MRHHALSADNGFAAQAVMRSVAWKITASPFPGRFQQGGWIAEVPRFASPADRAAPQWAECRRPRSSRMIIWPGSSSRPTVAEPAKTRPPMTRILALSTFIRIDRRCLLESSGRITGHCYRGGDISRMTFEPKPTSAPLLILTPFITLVPLPT